MYIVVQHWIGGRRFAACRPCAQQVCAHKHRSFNAARKCAKSSAIGVSACGASHCVNIYDWPGNVEVMPLNKPFGNEVEQWQACSVVSVRGRTTTWRTKPSLILPHSPLYMQIEG